MNTVYVSYDGALDALGSSQIVPYLLGLSARGIAITLLSFEKEQRWKDEDRRRAMQERLQAAGIRWRPIRYHQHPRVPATLYDIVAGARAVRQEVHARNATIVHCRGDVAMAMARRALLPRRTKLLYDIRGFFSDERVESGSWTRGGLVDRVVRRSESRNLARADALVVLTRAALAVLSARRESLPHHRVIPTCVDLDRFRPRVPREGADFGLCYVGSLGTWYMTDEMIAFAKAASTVIPGRVLILTPQVEEARRAGADPAWAEVRAASPEEVPQWTRRARAAFFFIRPTPAKRASCPTKLAEGLACGLPFVGNPGVGDVEDLVRQEPVGVLVERFDPSGYADAAQRLAELLARPETEGLCRRIAEREFSLHTAVGAYHELYLTLADEH